MALEDFKFSAILGTVGLLIGFIVGLSLPSGISILSNIDYTQASQDPANFITGYAVAVPLAITINVLSSLIGGLFMGIIGLIIDGVVSIKDSSQGSYL